MMRKFLLELDGEAGFSLYKYLTYCEDSTISMYQAAEEAMKIGLGVIEALAQNKIDEDHKQEEVDSVKNSFLIGWKAGKESDERALLT